MAQVTQRIKIIVKLCVCVFLFVGEVTTEHIPSGNQKWPWKIQPSFIDDFPTETVI